LCAVQEPPLEVKAGDDPAHRTACHFPLGDGEVLTAAVDEESAP